MLQTTLSAFAKLRFRREWRKRRKLEVEQIEARIQRRSERVWVASREDNFEKKAELIQELAKANEQDRAYLNVLTQQETLFKLEKADIKIPEEYLVRSPDHTNNLNREGESWARAALRKHKRDNIEFWFKLVMPVLSLIVSIVALYVATHKH